MDKIEIMRVESSHPESQGPFVTIDRANFDPKIHKEYKAKAPAAPAAFIPPAPVVPTAPAPVAPAAPAAPAPYVAPTVPSEVTNEEAFSSTEAIKAAEDAGLTSGDITGTGKDGKIKIGDVRKAIEDKAANKNPDGDFEE